MVRGFLTGPSPFFVFPTPGLPGGIILPVHKLVSRDADFLKILQLCLKLKENILFSNNQFYAYGSLTDSYLT